MTVGAIDFALMPWTSATFPGAAARRRGLRLASWSVMVSQQHRLIAAAPDAPSLVVSLTSSAIYPAVALAGVLGAGALSVAPGAFLPRLAAVFLLSGLAATFAARKFRR